MFYITAKKNLGAMRPSLSFHIGSGGQRSHLTRLLKVGKLNTFGIVTRATVILIFTLVKDIMAVEEGRFIRYCKTHRTDDRRHLGCHVLFVF